MYPALHEYLLIKESKMTSPVKLFTSKYMDEFGAEFPAAIIAVKECDEDFKRRRVSADCIENYTEVTITKGIAWEGRFWVDAEKKAAGYRSRAIVINTDHVFDKIVDVDITRSEIESVMAGSLQHDDKVNYAIELDFIHRFA